MFDQDENAPPADLLHLDRCPDCGYLLTGLPAEGLCPECGFAYNSKMIVLYGWARHIRGDEATRRRNRGWWASLSLKWLVILGILGGLGVLILLVRLVRLCYHRMHSSGDAPAPVQLRLQPEGFAQRDGVGQVTLNPWRSNKQQLIFERGDTGIWRIRSWRHMRLVIGRSSVVDFEFNCDETTAERIQEQIRQWRAQVPC